MMAIYGLIPERLWISRVASEKILKVGNRFGKRRVCRYSLEPIVYLMNPPSPVSSPNHHRSGVDSSRLVLILCGVLLCGFFISCGGDGTEKSEGESLFHQVERGDFIYTVVEPGQVESSSNVDVICEVKSRNSYGTVILEIVPEGTWVDKGDFICKLDDSELQYQLQKEQIDLNNAESQFIQAESDHENAKLALQEYESGTFPQEVKQHQSEEFVSRENLRRAEEFLSFSEKLAARDYISEVQLEADRFAVEKARKELEVSETKLEVLQTLTRRKRLNELQAKLKSSKVDQNSRQSIYELAKDKLEEIRQQISKCLVRAPASGQVVYGNRKGKSSGDILIEEGRPVREKQVIVRLPDPGKMHVIAKVNESRVDRIAIGYKAEIKLDAFARMTLAGEVSEISEYPLPSRHYLMEHIKEYATLVDILDPPAELRPGMTSEVMIVAEELEDVLQVPLQAVLEKDKGFYCLIGNNVKKLEAMPVELGSANEQFVVIKRGLKAGVSVAMNPRRFEEEIQFPSYPNEFRFKDRKSPSKKKNKSENEESDANRVTRLDKEGGLKTKAQ
jgi:HlyD family secretion protein